MRPVTVKKIRIKKILNEGGEFEVLKETELSER